jgi:GNAT superfamily N-acetyltransferase
MVKIRQLLKSEIPLLQDFPPKDWNLDLSALVSFHFDRSYFYPIAAEVDNKIVGCGNGYCHGKVGWLGNIIVVPDYRRQGIGKALTSHLMEYLKNKGCKTQLLIATEMGESVYRILGFKTSSSYIFFKRESPVTPQKISNIRKIKKEDIPLIKRLDREISGEERFDFIERFLSTAWIYTKETSDNIKGVYLPDFSNGLVIAKDTEAGLELMKLRLNQGKTNAIIPSANTCAKEFLLSQDFKEHRVVPRMVMGTETSWQPKMVYNRGSGYCG